MMFWVRIFSNMLLVVFTHFSEGAFAISSFTSNNPNKSALNEYKTWLKFGIKFVCQSPRE
jgi:hypothetical protein